jgi:hypothetical protein
MTQIEYKVEFLPFHPNEETHRAEFLALLNELGKDGWRLVEINPLERIHGGWAPSSPIPMLLAREVTK